MSERLSRIAAEPQRIDALRCDELPELLAELEGLRAKLWSRGLVHSSAVPAAPTQPEPTSNGRDAMLTAEEAAQRIGVTKRWMYRHADQLPFTHRPSAGTLRFSARGLERWLARRRAK